ncbi:TetR/AcrR family transcriptional regulator [Micromonospora sp. 15K316]|uniref:TetR family transcriptional regulator n=1 Tax=Micromonospora sp. 15K316 TaxID=2530376 RepID=UPI00104E30AA|nr:TetR family transcriptional regulator [Micromonospora sp. 15K316]TDC28700.1 TetR/AcrR family transcriptional regulator [Micromonospora sp. 15K316]
MSSDPGTLSAERILDTAEEVLRRYGPAKATVLDVARALGVSHGSVYRHFPSKAALRAAVTERWLTRISTPLAGVAGAEGPAGERLRRWLFELNRAKRRISREDPELFDTFHLLAAQSEGVVEAHREVLTGQLTVIVADGVASGEFDVADPALAARAVLQATTRFHHPAHVSEWDEPVLEDELALVLALLLDGLRVRRAS